MKQTKQILWLLFFFGSLSAINAQEKKVAVVTFYSNTMVGFDELGLGSETLIKDVLELRDNPNFNLKPILEKYHDAFFNSYAKEFPFKLLPESDVVNSEKYKAYSPKYPLDTYDAKDYLMYGDYKYIYEGINGRVNEEGVAKLFENEADGVLFVNIHFSFEKGFGVGGTASLKMKAYTRIALYNKKGEKVFVINEAERSKKTGVMVKGIPVMKADKILPMCESAMDELMGDLQKRIAKVVKKSNEKL